MVNKSNNNNNPHVAVCASAGMGHLKPFLRAASMLSSSGCKVTLMTIKPALTAAETTQISAFFANHPHINSLEVQLPSTDHNSVTKDDVDVNNASITTKPFGGSPDPYFLRYTAISTSAQLLADHLVNLSPPPTAVLSDIMFISGFTKVLCDFNIPIYCLPITSAWCFTLTFYLSNNNNSYDFDGEKSEIEVGFGVDPIPKSSVPPTFCNPNHLFTKLLFSNNCWLHKCKGIVMNTFEYFEGKNLQGLGKVLENIPPIYPIGPLHELKYECDDRKEKDSHFDDSHCFEWLDKQPSESVLYVNFGSRTAMKEDQIRELGNGLEMSGVRFLWVVKTTEVDKEEKMGLSELLGEDFLEKVKKGGKGLVVKGWVDQHRALVHPSTGGFVTHCGWNSTVEAAQSGLPTLAWPLHGDNRLNADVIEKAGLGLWSRDWGWIGSRLVKRDEIAGMIKKVMMNEGLRKSARRVGEEASKAWSKNGSSYLMMAKLVQDMASHVKN